MLSKEDRDQLKKQEDDFKQQSKQRRAELKQLKKESREAARQRRKEKNQAGRPPKKKKPKITRTVLDVFPIRDYQEPFYLTDDNQLIDIFQIRGKSYYNASDEEVNSMVDTSAAFYRIYKPDLKFISLNYPTNTRQQQAFLAYKLQQPGLEKFRDLINEKLSALQYLEDNTTDREAFVMVFARNENHYETLRRLLDRSGLNIVPVSKEKKDNIIFQLNNMCKKVRV